MDESSSKSRRWRIGWLAGAAVLFGLLLAVGGWFAWGAKVWTDGNSFRIADRDTRVRQVIWTSPVPLDSFASDEQVYEPAVSPDGTELYFVRGKAGRNAKIYVSHRHNNVWTAPAAIDAIDGPFDSLGPRPTPDGSLLLFYSDRPGGFGGYDIWAAPRNGNGWGAPFNLGSHVNSEFNEFNPDPTPDGRHLIFATNRKAARREQREAWRSTIRQTVSSDYDLWIADADFSLLARRAPATTQPATMPWAQKAVPAPESAGLAFRPAHEIAGINTPFSEGASCMSPAGDFLYFASNRPGGLGRFDVYRSRVRGGQFAPPENVGPPINSSENEADPALAYNGFRMFFSSDRPGADGRYHLLVSDSREVYPERLTPALPHLGWSWLVLLISLLVLVPLLMFFRGWDERRLSVLQKCLLLSLLVHALITFILSFVVVTQKVARYVRAQSELQIPVDVGEGQAAAEAMAVRGQLSVDLPVAVSPPASLMRQAIASVPMEMSPADVSVPAGRLAPNGITLAADAPHSMLPMTQVQPMPVEPRGTAPSAMMDVKLPSLRQVPQARHDTEPVAAAPAGGTAGFAQPRLLLPGGAGPAEVSAPDMPLSKIAKAMELPVAGVQIEKALPGHAGDALGSGKMPSPWVGSEGSDPKVAALAATAAPKIAAVSEPRLLASGLQAAPTTQPIAQAAVTSTNLPPGGAIQPASAPPNRPSGKTGLQFPAMRSAAREMASAMPPVAVRPSIATAPRELGAVHLAASPGVKLAGKSESSLPAGAPVAAAAVGRMAANHSISGIGPPELGARDARLSAADASGPELASAPAARIVVPALVEGAGAPPAPQAVAPDIRGTVPQFAGPQMPLPSGASRAMAQAEPTIASVAAKAALGPAPRLGNAAPDIANIPPAPVAASDAMHAADRAVPQSGGPRRQVVEIASAPIQPDAGITAFDLPLGAVKGTTPDLSFLRAPEQRKPLLERFGGTKESEDAVDRGLAYLARMQEEDGHWTRIETDERPDDNAHGRHDMACTGLALLAFLGHDHTPNRAGPYRTAVSNAVDWLISQQGDDGDLRGPRRFRGGGSDSANMYDQGIVTYALAECAAMTHDPKTIAAAIKGAQFIVGAQDPRSGGWRYSPNEYGDSSVFGWQVMALHSAERIGFETPPRTAESARRYIQSCGQGRHPMLGGYQPHQGPTAAMTAELLFSRMLLGMPMDEDGIGEATHFLARDPPDFHNADLYYWYYASLSMLHMRNPLWKDWNVLTRESLIRMQRKDGDAIGCWDTHVKWGDRGGRVFTTALATLTLEVYYRYLPMRPAEQ